MDKSTAIARYSSLYSDLNTLVLEWDPLGLYTAGELSDEFSDEVTRVLALLPACQTASDTAEAIRSVFAASFSAVSFPPGSCDDIGSTVHTWWASQA